MTEMVFAVSQSSLVMHDVFADWDWDLYPLTTLWTFAHSQYIRTIDKLHIRGPLMLDSGAYSAWTIGATIDIDALIAAEKARAWRYVVALDVIGSPSESRANAFYMKEHGSKAFPVFHQGEPFELLKEYCQHWDLVGLSCRLGENKKTSEWFYEQCFRRAFPHRFHSFGWAEEGILSRYPFWSADSTSWQASFRYGRWTSLGGFYSPMRAKKGNPIYTATKGEVLHYWHMQEKLKARWRKELSRWTA